MKHALVLGGNGFIGSALTNRLIKEGFAVTAVDRSWENNKSATIKCITGDVFDTSLLENLLPNVDIVFHLVSTTLPSSSNQRVGFDCESNVMGTLRILDTMVKCQVKHIIFASSGGTVYGIPKTLPISEENPLYPISAYGVGKIAIEKYLNLYSYLYDIKATVLRLSNPFGPGQQPEREQGVIATFAKRIMSNEPIQIWGDGSVVRDFIYIEDVIDAFIEGAKIVDPFLTINIGVGKGYSLTEIIKAIELRSSKSALIEFKPSRKCDVPAIILDISRAKKYLGWSPKHNLNQGIDKLITVLEAAEKSILKTSTA